MRGCTRCRSGCRVSCTSRVPALARGYHRRPASDRRTVRRRPVRRPGERMYRTGDLVRWRTDRTLEYLGRTDFQVKVRGFRIELGEIEAAVLAAHPASRRPSRSCTTGTAGGHALVAYVVPGAGAADRRRGELRAAVGSRLPAYMVPSAIVVLDAIPLTPIGQARPQGAAGAGVRRGRGVPRADAPRSRRSSRTSSPRCSASTGSVSTTTSSTSAATR